MAASETRQGPGWWMDPHGGWNPPEMWPEATPPLPGWTRGLNGLWSAPERVTPAPVVDGASLKLTEASPNPVIDLTEKRHSRRPKLPLSRRQSNVTTGYSPAHAREKLVDESALVEAPQPNNSEFRLGYAKKPLQTPVEDEPIISRRLIVGFSLAFVGIAALIAGLVIIVMLL